MTWGPSFMYYICEHCGCKFKYEISRIPEFSEDFGRCPQCGAMGQYVKDGARTSDDDKYTEVD